MKGKSKMKKIMFAAFAVAFMTGCRVVEVENRGEGIVTDANGAPLVVNGALQKYNKGWNVYHNQHWMMTKADTMEAHIKPDDISFSMNGLDAQPSEYSVKYIDTVFTGTTTLASKVVAACLTGGISVAAEGGAQTVENLCKLYAAKGGNVEKTEITVDKTKGTVTLSDGNVTETGTVCTNCADGSCTVK